MKQMSLLDQTRVYITHRAGMKQILQLTHWGRVTHICVSDLTSIGSDNGLSPGRRQAIIRTNAGILLIRPLGTNFIEFLVEILIFSFKKMRLKVSSAKRRSFCLGLNELRPNTCDRLVFIHVKDLWASESMKLDSWPSTDHVTSYAVILRKASHI